MADFDGDGEERLTQEAEELMRQRRFHDAAQRYQDLHARAPGDLWVSLGHASALECAGRIEEAGRLLEEAVRHHRASAHLQRFRHLFFVRREDLRAAAQASKAIAAGVGDDGPEDQLAELYFNQGRYLEALAELERLLGRGIEDRQLQVSVLARSGACLRQQGDLERARARLLEALALDPESHWTLSELAETERSLGEVEAARRHYLEALRSQPDDQWTRGHLAQLEHESGDDAAAVKLYEEILAAEPRAGWAKVELAQVLAAKDPERAAGLCREVVDGDPKNPWANAQLAQLARHDGRHEDARSLLQQALGGAPDAPWLLHELADTCRQLGRLPEAYSHLERAEGADPYHAATFGFRADFLRGEGKLAEARTNLEKAVDLDPDYSWAWRELAEVRALMGDHPAAEAAWRRACAAEPDVAANDGLRAFLLRCQDRRDAAIPWLERAVERQDDYLWAWRELAEHHLAAERPAEAERALRAALAKHQEAPVLWGLLAESLRRQERRAEAAEACERALALDARVPQLWAIRAELYAEAKAFDPAVSAARKALELDRSGDFRLLLAQVLAAAGRHGEARAEAEAVVAGGRATAAGIELAAALAERAGDAAAARAHVERALAGAQAGDPRLLLRRLHLEAEGGAAPDPAGLDPVLAASGRADLAWTEVARLAVRLGSPARARRAAHLALEHAAPGERARAWTALGETELALGDPAGAEDAVAQALALDPLLLPARVMAAVLREQRGDHAGALAHLRQLERREGADAAAALPAVWRQMAVLHERAGDHAAAAAAWARIAAHPGAGAGMLAERAAFLWRRGDGPAAQAAQAAAAAAGCARDGEEWQRLLSDAALARADAEGAAAALEQLAGHEAELGGDLRLLAARLALAAGRPEEARRRAEAVAGSRPAALLAVRARIAGRDIPAAAAAAEALLAAQPGDEEAAVLLAECRAAEGRFAESVAVAAADALPARPGLERGLLLAAVELELRGEAACAARLARIENPDRAVPLVRAFAAAWPGQPLAEDPDQPLRAGDIEHLPGFPRAAARLGAALAAAGHAAFAAAYLRLVLAQLPAGVARAHRRALWWRLAAAEWRAGARRRAVAAALHLWW